MTYLGAQAQHIMIVFKGRYAKSLLKMWMQSRQLLYMR